MHTLHHTNKPASSSSRPSLSDSHSANNHANIKKRPSLIALVPKPTAQIPTPTPTPTRPASSLSRQNTRVTAVATRTTRNTTIDAPRTTTTTARTALYPKDRNVPPSSVAAAPRSPALAAPARQRPSPPAKLIPTIRMPPTNTSSRQPQMPSLAKPNGRAPLTPKIAGARPLSTSSTPQPQQPTSRPLSGYGTPLPRRTPGRPDSSPGGLGVLDTPDNNVASPANATYGQTNITPRSGMRQTRVDSASSTPTGTPQPEQKETWDARPTLAGPMYSDNDGPRRQVVTFSPATSEFGKPLSARPAVPESKFFYASSAKSTPPQTATPTAKPFPPLQKASTFCYANGDTLAPKQGPAVAVSSPASVSFSPVLPGTPEAFSSKFMYANGAPDVLPSPAKGTFTPASRPGSSMSTTSKVPAGRPASALGANPTMGFGSQRPMSPLKQPFNPAPKAAGGLGGLQSAISRPAPPTSTHSLPTATLMMRRTSIETTPIHTGNTGFVPGHGRKISQSAMSDVPLSASRVLPPRSPSESSSPGFGGATAAPAIGFASLLQAAEDFAEDYEDDEDEDDMDPDESQDDTNSPTKSKDPVDELVSNARRERKVQDLQITNASLEAINRTLERQLRKQTAEIRRYKRLSRSGRLSLASMGSRVASDATVEGPLMDPSRLGLEDLSEEEGGGEYSQDEQDDLDADESPDEFSESEYGSASGSSQLSPSTMALRDSRHRQRDEKRLRLDLTKHQQILVESQKINQSIKRCLSWTEELIKDGKRALEYQVRISEVEIGGRLLMLQDDEDGDGGMEDDEEMGAVTVDFGHGDDTMTNLSFGGKGAQDRDSGIDLPPDGV